MTIRAIRPKVDVEVICDNEECGEEGFTNGDFDVFNDCLSEHLNDLVVEDWLFKQDARWSEEYFKVHGKRPAGIDRGLYCFCSDECFKKWLEDEGYKEENFIDATDDLGNFVFNGIEEETDAER